MYTMYCANIELISQQRATQFRLQYNFESILHGCEETLIKYPATVSIPILLEKRWNFQLAMSYVINCAVYYQLRGHVHVPQLERSPKKGCHEIVAIEAIAACRSLRTGGFQSEKAAAWRDGFLRLRVSTPRKLAAHD